MAKSEPDPDSIQHFRHPCSLSNRPRLRKELIMSYDRADWHYGGDYPKDMPPENGGTHIGIFLAWAIIHHLEGDLHH